MNATTCIPIMSMLLSSLSFLILLLLITTVVIVVIVVSLLSLCSSVSSSNSSTVRSCTIHLTLVHADCRREEGEDGDEGTTNQGKLDRA